MAPRLRPPLSARGALRRAGGTLTILRELPGQRRIPYLPADRIAELRDRRVRELAAFAAAHVPHYRDLGLDPREIQTAGDLAKLPLIDKKKIQEDPERFRPETPDRDDVRPFRTAGSTGIPLTIPHDRRSLLANIAWGERERAAEMRLCGRRYGYDVADGANVHPVLVRVACDTSREVLRFQVVQEALDRFRLKLVVADPLRFEEVAWEVLKALDRVFPECRIECERHDELAPEPETRKFHAVVPLRSAGS